MALIVDAQSRLAFPTN